MAKKKEMTEIEKMELARALHNAHDWKDERIEREKKKENFVNSDDFLKRETARVARERKSLGLEGLVGSLEAIIINTQEEHHKAAVEELLATTGYHHNTSYLNKYFITSILKLENSADIIIRNRNNPGNPFQKYNLNPKSEYLPDTRLETFIFNSTDIASYYKIQKNRGIKFLTPYIVEYENYLFIQSMPSEYTGISIGIIQWKNNKGEYTSGKDTMLPWEFTKPLRPYLANIGNLDHTATRVRAQHRDPAIIEFMELTNYNFDFAIYVKSLNSITNVARLSSKDFAMVFTSGIAPFTNLENSGPTEKYIYNYGARTHHMAFNTQNIEDVYQKLKNDGVKYLVELIGSPEEGLKQTFTIASPNTLIVNEYIHRYGDFTGFFTRQNVTVLTGSTNKQ